MLRQSQKILQRSLSKTFMYSKSLSSKSENNSKMVGSLLVVSMWRRKMVISREGLIVVKDLKRLERDPIRFERYMKSNVSRLLKSDVVAVLTEFQRQNLVSLCMKLYPVVKKEIWYRPDMFFYREMLMMLARNKQGDIATKVWNDLREDGILFDQHTFGDIVRAFLDAGLPKLAMHIYGEMRRSLDPPLSLPYRVMLKGTLPYPELRDRLKYDLLELFPKIILDDSSEDSSEDQRPRTDDEDEY